MTTFSLQMPDKLKAQLDAIAARYAVAPDAFILATLASAVQVEFQEEKPFWATATLQERADDFERWTRIHATGAGLSDEALRRESMYEDR